MSHTPLIFYTEEDFLYVVRERNDALKSVETLENLRPHWAKGHSSDSVAAQSAIAALSEIWQELNVKNQTEALAKLRIALESMVQAPGYKILLSNQAQGINELKLLNSELVEALKFYANGWCGTEKANSAIAKADVS